MPNHQREALAKAVQKVRRRIAQVRERGERIGEENTKAALIDPILAALGWDLEELEEVSREYKRKPQDNPVDYALFIMRSPRLFVEAKALEQNLDDRKWVSQTLGYATVVGVQWCVLTNGDEYRIFNSHAAVDVDEKLFRTIKITDKDKIDYTIDTLELLSKDKMGDNIINVLWKTHFIDHHVKCALQELFDNEDPLLIKAIRKNTQGLKPSEIKDSLKRADIRIDFPLFQPPQHTDVKEAPTRPAAPTSPAKKTGPNKGKTPNMLGVEPADLIAAGIVRPPLKLEKNYKKVNVKAEIMADGSVLFDGVKYNSLSLAAGMARNKVIGKPTDRPYHPTNGWSFWQFTEPQTGKLKNIDALRQKYLATQKGRPGLKVVE